MAESPPVSDLADEEYCYLVTTGRVSGLPREIEIWFGVIDSTLYMLSGNRDSANWVKNISMNPVVHVRISGHVFSGNARIVKATDSDNEPARELLFDKYRQIFEGDLTNWSKTALPIAVDITG